MFGITLKIIWNFFAKKNTPAVQAVEGKPRKLLARISKTHWRFIAGCTLAVATLIPASLPSVGGVDAYPAFIANSLKHKATPLTNHMGLPTLLSYHPKRTSRYTKNSKLKDPFAVWKSERKRTLRDRRALHVGLLLLFAALIMYTGRRLEDWAVTSLSILFIIGIFELTCYYYNFIVLLAPFAMKKPRYTVAYIGMAIATHVVSLRWLRYDEQYTWETLTVLLPILYMLVDTAWDQWKEDRAAKMGDPVVSEDEQPTDDKLEGEELPA